MKKLTTKFVLDHIDEQFMIGINALYWTGTLKSSMTNVLEEEEYPTYSEQFYRCYGSFSPLNPDIALCDIREERCSIGFIDTSIAWEDFVLDVIGFFHHSNCLHGIKRLIKDKFCDHYEYTASINDSEQEAVAKKVLDEYNDARMLTFFEFRNYLWRWDSRDTSDDEPMSITEQSVDPAAGLSHRK